MLKRTHLVSLLLMLLTCSAVFAEAPTRSTRIANYDIKVTLDVEAKKLLGTQTLLWKNTSLDTIKEMQFHLYLNAFKNQESTFIKEWGRIPDLFVQQLLIENEWGSIAFLEIRDEQGNDLKNNIKFLHPDDDNTKDETVAALLLMEPVLPGEEISLNMEWAARLPKAMVRTGYNKDFYFAAQWFPKVGVYEPGKNDGRNGRWNCHQYHSAGEYFSDFGVYNVEISVPPDFIVGATGMLVNETTSNNLKTYSFTAEDVIDFTWAASPHFVVQEKQWKGVEIKYFSYPDHAHVADRYFPVLEKTLSFFEEKLEKYPYKNLTVIEPPFSGLFAMGMEYPQLISVGSICFLPRGIRSAEALAAHEFIHQYFMQILASNETEEPWLDEGLTTYYEGRILDEMYGANTSFIDWFGIQAGTKEVIRNTYVNSPNLKIAACNQPSWDFKDGGYQMITYNKTGVWMWTLEGLVGTETMDEIMKTYYNRWKFRHPNGSNFIKVVNDIVIKRHGDKFGESMGWFFDQVLNETTACDFAVSHIRNYTEQKPKSIAQESKLNNANTFNAEFTVQRIEDMVLPVEILVQFDNGNTLVENWDGKSRAKTYTYQDTCRIVSVQLDPNQKLMLDKDSTNNSITVKTSDVPTNLYLNKFVCWMQTFMQAMMFLA